MPNISKNKQVVAYKHTDFWQPADTLRDYKKLKIFGIVKKHPGRYGNNKKKFWKNKKVLITGHTGFKGSWLSIILNNYEAKLYGISLKPEKNLYLKFQN